MWFQNRKSITTTTPPKLPVLVHILDHPNLLHPFPSQNYPKSRLGRSPLSVNIHHSGARIEIMHILDHLNLDTGRQLFSIKIQDSGMHILDHPNLARPSQCHKLLSTQDRTKRPSGRLPLSIQTRYPGSNIDDARAFQQGIQRAFYSGSINKDFDVEFLDAALMEFPVYSQPTMRISPQP